jgi:hypothetical protein
MTIHDTKIHDTKIHDAKIHDTKIHDAKSLYGWVGDKYLNLTYDVEVLILFVSSISLFSFQLKLKTIK